MKILYFTLIIVTFLLNACSSVRDSAGVSRKSIDEFQVIENPPLVIPPDYNLIEPNQLKDNNINDLEQELAKEILFGVDDNNALQSVQLSTMNQMLSEMNSIENSNLIREEIDREFAQEIDTDGIFQTSWKTEVEILDAIKESERIRNNKFEGKNINEGEVPVKIKTLKIKKKKRFFFF